MDYRAELAKELYLFRREKCLSQEKMAERCQMTLRYYNDVENGKANPTLAMLSKLVKGTGIELIRRVRTAERKPEEKVRYQAVANKSGTFDLVGYNRLGRGVIWVRDASCDEEYAVNAAKFFTENRLLPEQLRETVCSLQGFLL